MLHTIQVNDVISIIFACCGFGGCNTGRHVPQLRIAGRLSVSELCLMLDIYSTKLLKLYGFRSLVLYGLLTGLFCTLLGFY